MEWIYPILGKQKCLVSHQFLYTQSGRGSLHVGGEQFILEGGSVLFRTGNPT